MLLALYVLVVPSVPSLPNQCQQQRRRWWETVLLWRASCANRAIIPAEQCVALFPSDRRPETTETLAAWQPAHTRCAPPAVIQRVCLTAPLAGCRLRTYNGVQREQRCKTAKYVSEAQRGGIRPGHGNYICRSGSGWPRRSETGLLRELRALRCCSCSGASAPVAPKAVPGLPVSARTSAVSRFRRPVPCARLARSADGAAPERRKKKKKEKSKHQHGTPRLSCFRGCSEG